MAQTKSWLLIIKKHNPEIFSLECSKICFILRHMIFKKIKVINQTLLGKIFNFQNWILINEC